MSTSDSAVEPIRWVDDHLQLIDQRKLPEELTYLDCFTSAQVVDAIRDMVVRGAPAIGIAAAYGVVLAARESKRVRGYAFDELDKRVSALLAARPTAVNLAWAVKQMMTVMGNGVQPSDAEVLAFAERLHAEDVAVNRKMGDFGATLLGNDARVITHCNAGALATAGYGTALGVIRSAFRDNKLAKVYACETRPWLQGARLTAWELLQDDIPVTLLADGAAAQLMYRAQDRSDKISWVITGADRVAANGDVANKIGTYALALAARAHGVGMMVVAPRSTIDLDTPTGADIPIENRAEEELLSLNGVRVAAANAAAVNPVFDITPAHYVDVLVTEKGPIHCPDRSQLEALF
ncbi:MAG: S-methyl-5-thioribose-1-phosphate isomerase [Pseudomonadota bacterium]